MKSLRQRGYYWKVSQDIKATKFTDDKWSPGSSHGLRYNITGQGAKSKTWRGHHFLTQHPAHDCGLWNAKVLLTLVSTAPLSFQKLEFLCHLVGLLRKTQIKMQHWSWLKLASTTWVFGKLTGSSVKVWHRPELVLICRSWTHFLLGNGDFRITGLEASVGYLEGSRSG